MTQICALYVYTMIAAPPLQLTTRLSNKSWVSIGPNSRVFLGLKRCLQLGDEHSDEEDPFAEVKQNFPSLSAHNTELFQIDEGFAEDDLEANLQRDKHARLCNSVNQLIDELTPAAPDFQLQEACNQLVPV